MTEATSEKPCRMCGDMMPMTPTSRRVYCPDCYRKNTNEKTRRLRAKRRENIDPAAAWHGTNQGYTNYGCRCERCRGGYRAYYDARKVRPEVVARIREQSRTNARKPEYKLKKRARKYGLDPQVLEENLAVGRCFACDVADPALSVDHDHACCPRGTSCGDCVRGLLCASCNLALGAIGDSRTRLRHLIAYLDRWEERRG